MLSFSFYLKIFIKFVPDFAYLDVFATYLKCKSLKLNKLHIYKRQWTQPPQKKIYLILATCAWLKYGPRIPIASDDKWEQ